MRTLEGFLMCSPFKKTKDEKYEYIHKSIYEYYIADIYIEELTILIREA